MPESIPDDFVHDISLEDAKVLRRQLSNRIMAIRKKKSLRMEVYIQAEYRDAVETAKAWAFENGYIRRDTKWTFAKFCIINTTKMILNKMEEEKAKKERTENTQFQPNTVNNRTTSRQP